MLRHLYTAPPSSLEQLMFSRDSQVSSDSKMTRDSKLASHRKGQAATYEETEIEPIERSQSWQVAPNLFTSFKYAWAGIAYAFTTQRNFRVHTGVGIIAMILCWALSISTAEIAIICLTIGAVLVMEILNTALESLVDLTVGQTYHELAKVAKDCAAGAVLMAAIVALLIAALIFIPPLWNTLQAHIA